MPKITRILIKDYRSIRRLEVTPGAKGAIAKGRNAAGKTSVLKAITAALGARGIDAKDIRNGEDKAEIMVDLDNLRVARKITQNSSQVTVTEQGGETWKRPQTRLTELLGTAAVDPLEFFLAKPPERRRMVLDAIPVDVTFADIDRWTEGGAAALGLQPDYLVKGAGLEEVERLMKLFYDRRTDANRDAKDARAEADRCADAAALTPEDRHALPVDQAEANARAARARLDHLRGQAAAASAAGDASQKTQARIDYLRAERSRMEKDCAPPSEVEDRLTAKAVDEAKWMVDEAERQLVLARQRLDHAREERTAVEDRFKSAAAIRDKMAEVDQQVTALDETLADVKKMGCSPSDLEQAAADVEQTEREVKRSQAAARAGELAQAATVAKSRAREREATAGRLDDVVKTLTGAAQRELAQRADIMPGLSFEGDEVLLDDVRVGELCGAEQMRFAVDLARRLNAKAKILVVDGLERLDDGRMRDFITMATAEDFQLFATKVENGDLVVEAIEP